MESDIVFDNAILLSHSAYSKGYGCKLNDVSIRDYKTGGFNDKIVCIDLDSYEKIEKSGSPDKTMDAVIGISNYQNNRRVSKRLLMVELRLDYKSSRNLSGTELRRKSSHSRELLGYKDRWNSLTVEEFNNYFQDAELLPYSPIYSPAQISGEIESCGKDIERIIKISDKWLQEARNYAVRYNFNETESICNSAITSLESILCKYHFDDEEEQWYIEDMISDYKGVLKSAKRQI